MHGEEETIFWNIFFHIVLKDTNSSEKNNKIKKFYKVKTVTKSISIIKA